MNSEEFVEAVKRHVGDATIAYTIANLRQPPGRRVLLKKRVISEWYNALSAEDTEHVNSVISTAVHGVLFGIFAVLDGVRTIDEEGGRFELTFVAGQRVILNDPQAISLHELLNSTD